MALCSSPATRTTDQVLEAMRWYFGKRHCRSVAFVNDTAGNQDGLYFDLNTIDVNYAEKKYVILLSDGTTTTAPTTTGSTLITVTFVANDTAEDIAALFSAALIAASVDVKTEVVDGTVEYRNFFVGLITPEVSTNAAGLTFAVGDAGFGGYIGQTGESELTTTTEVTQLIDDAQGSIVLDEVINGYTAELGLSLREMTTQRWKDLIGQVTGNNITIDSAEITGFGTKKLYQSMFNFSGRLVGHPIRNLASNISEDITMLNTAPKMDSINFSGSAIQEASFTFLAYKANNVPDAINLFARGDHSKF